MAANINIVPASEFLVGNAEGEMDLEQTRAHLLQLLRTAAISGTANILLDVREAKSRMRAFELFSLVSLFDKMVPLFAGRLAILNCPKDAFNRAEFFSMCAQHRGFQVEAFQEYEDAVQWLYPPLPVDTQVLRRLGRRASAGPSAVETSGSNT